MKKFILSIILIIIAVFQLTAQVDTTKTPNLLNELSLADKDTTALLPKKILFTQKLFWGEKGLMRHFSEFELTPEKRQKELKLRRVMLVAHQSLGFLTLGGMIAQGFVGAKLYNDPYNSKLRETHEALAAGVNFGYFTTASLALFAPPKMLDERKGFSSIKLHRSLAIIHLTSMIATNILAGQLEGHPDLRPYHRAAAFTAFGAFAASMIVIKF